MDDLVERLRGNGQPFSFAEIIAEIERLASGRDLMGNLWAKEKEENARLRAALRRISVRKDYQLPSAADIALEALGERLKD